MKTTYESILIQLRSEINKTLLFFVQTDLKMYGFVRKDTVKCFEAQKTPFPAILNDLIEPNTVMI